jgi:hypothetical protein
MSEPRHAEFWVNGIVSHRDNKPYIQLSNEKGIFTQLTMKQARAIAHDILVMCSRTEADAMVLKFFHDTGLPAEGAAAMMVAFREFRAALDDEVLQHTHRGEVQE